MTEDERKEMCEVHFGMVEVVVDEFLSRERYRKYRRLRDEFLGIGYETLLRCSREFKISKGVKFSTFASHSIRNRMKNLILRERRRVDISIDDVTDGPDEPFVVDVYHDAASYEQLVNDLEPEDAVLRYIYHSIIVNGEDKEDVAKQLGISAHHVAHLKKKTIKYINKNKRGVYEDYRNC